MAKIILSLLIIAGLATFATATFTDESCKTTLYPNDCATFIGAHAKEIGEDQLKLVKVALTENLAKTQDLKNSMSNMATGQGLKGNEHAALKDCLNQVGDGEDELKKAIEELKGLGPSVGPDFDFRMSNVKTWVSSVLTNFDSCVEGFKQPSLNGKTKDLIGPKVEELERATSNALAFMNHIPIKTQ